MVCISDEAHSAQTNLDQKVTVTEKDVKICYGFARYLRDSLPNATYVDFIGTPVDATLDVFGREVDIYTMDEIRKGWHYCANRLRRACRKGGAEQFRSRRY